MLNCLGEELDFSTAAQELGFLKRRQTPAGNTLVNVRR